MEKEEVKKLVQEEVGDKVAGAFGVMKEFLQDQFAAITENFKAMDEKMDRGFKEVHEELDHIKTRLDDMSVDMVDVKQRLTKLEEKEEHEVDPSWRRS